MKAIRIALAIGLFTVGIARAEVGVAMRPGSVGSAVVYELVGLTEDPTPFNQIWRRHILLDDHRVALNPGGESNGDGVPSILANPAENPGGASPPAAPIIAAR